VASFLVVAAPIRGRRRVVVLVVQSPRPRRRGRRVVGQSLMVVEASVEAAGAPPEISRWGVGGAVRLRSWCGGRRSGGSGREAARRAMAAVLRWGSGPEPGVES
jgi:hypothetical protein